MGKETVPQLKVTAPTPPQSPSHSPPRTSSVSSKASAGSVGDANITQRSTDQLTENTDLFARLSRGRAKAIEDEKQELQLFDEKRRQQQILQKRLADPDRIKFKWNHIPYNVLRWVPDVMQSLKLSNEDLQFHSTLLLDHNFDTKQNVAGHKGPHSRFMRPGCKHFPSSSLSSNILDQVQSSDQLYVFVRHNFV